VAYESYEYDQYGEQYDPYGRDRQGGGQGQPYQEPYAEQYPEQQYAEQQYPEQQFPEQQYQEYPEQYGQQQYAEQEQYAEQAYQEGSYQQGYGGEPQFAQQPQYQDAQWAQSGLGWERQAWDEARLGVSPLQELEYPGQEQGYGYPQAEGYAGPEYDQQQYGEQQQYDDRQQYEQYGEGDRYPRERALPGDLEVPDYPPGEEDEAGLPGQRARRPEPDEVATPAAGSAAAAAPAASGRGAFGAAGLCVVAAVCALAGSGALLVAIALIQAGIGYGWQQATTVRENGRPDRRAAVLTALFGWTACACAFRLPANEDSIGLPATLGVGFLLLAADQALRSRPLGSGERVAGLAVAVSGGVFAVLPAGFVAAERTDSTLTATCALAAAVGVLCCALLGRDPVRGILAGLVLGAGIGAVAAQSLSAQGGLNAGALGGAVSALAAATALGAMDRITAEGEARGSTRIVSQVLPVALAAMGALFAAAVFR